MVSLLEGVTKDTTARYELYEIETGVYNLVVDAGDGVEMNWIYENLPEKKLKSLRRDLAKARSLERLLVIAEESYALFA